MTAGPNAIRDAGTWVWMTTVLADWWDHNPRDAHDAIACEARRQLEDARLTCLRTPRIVVDTDTRQGAGHRASYLVTVSAPVAHLPNRYQTRLDV